MTSRRRQRRGLARVEWERVRRFWFMAGFFDAFYRDARAQDN